MYGSDHFVVAGFVTTAYCEPGDDLPGAVRGRLRPPTPEVGGASPVILQREPMGVAPIMSTRIH
jgi:hypothetical protein